MKGTKIVLIVVALCVTCIVGAFILARPWISLRRVDTLSVKGYAELPIRSDSAAMTVTVKNAVPELSAAYELSSKQIERIVSMAKESLKQSEINPPWTNVKEIYMLDQKGKKTNTVEKYSVEKTLRIETTDVDGMESFAQRIYDLNKEGIFVTIGGPSYFVNKLEDIKLKLVRMATENGRMRANEMVSSAGYNLSRLVSARQGIVQITTRNSTETSDWGVYDTSTIDKVAKLAVTLEYEIK